MRSNPNVEVARLAGFAAIVVLHVNALKLFRPDYQAIGWVLDEINRFAVPVFFLISGYFFHPAQTSAAGQALAQIRKLALPFVFWAFLYVLLDYREVLAPSSVDRNWHAYLTAPWTGSVAFHLWFVPGLIVGSFISLSLLRHVSLRTALLVSICLYAIGAILGTYVRPAGLILPLGIYRNGLFFAPVFLVSGYALSTLGRLPSSAFVFGCTMVGLFLHLIEGYYVFGTYPRGHDISFGTLPYSVGVFCLFLAYGHGAKGVACWGRDVFGAYLIHLLVLKGVIAVLPAVLPLAGTLGVWLFVTLASLLLSRLAKSNSLTRQIMP